MTSFRRAENRGPASVAMKQPGTKPFINNQTLISSGLRELDTILGGGFLMRTVAVVEAPVFGSYAIDLARYFAAEGLAASHCTLVNKQLFEKLPLELSLAQKQVKNDWKQFQNTEKDSDAKLKIAWQYDKYTAESETNQSTRFCHSFDLSKDMQEELKSRCQVIDLENISQDTPSMYRTLFQDIAKNLVQMESKQNAIRIVLTDIGSYHYGDLNERHFHELTQFLRALRGIIRTNKKATCMLSMPLHLFPKSIAAEIRHICDYALEMSSFMGEMSNLPMELRDFHGLFCIHKLARMQSLACHAVDTVKFGVKRENRKLKLEKLHLPPEESRSSSNNSNTGNSNSSNFNRSSLVMSTPVTKKSSITCGSMESKSSYALSF